MGILVPTDVFLPAHFFPTAYPQSCLSSLHGIGMCFRRTQEASLSAGGHTFGNSCLHDRRRHGLKPPFCGITHLWLDRVCITAILSLILSRKSFCFLSTKSSRNSKSTQRYNKARNPTLAEPCIFWKLMLGGGGFAGTCEEKPQDWGSAA